MLETKQESEQDSDVHKIVLFAKEAEIVPEPEQSGNDAGQSLLGVVGVCEALK